MPDNWAGGLAKCPVCKNVVQISTNITAQPPRSTKPIPQGPAAPQSPAGAPEQPVASVAASPGRSWWLSWKVTVPLVAILVAGVTAVVLFKPALIDWTRNEFNEDARFFPDDCQIIFSVNVEEIQSSQAGHTILHQIEARYSDADKDTSEQEGFEKAWGFNLSEVRRVSFGGLFSETGAGIDEVMVVRTKKPITSAAILDKRTSKFDKKIIGKHTYYEIKEKAASATRYEPNAFAVPDSRTVIFGEPKVLKLVLGREYTRITPQSLHNVVTDVKFDRGMGLVIDLKDIADPARKQWGLDFERLSKGLVRDAKGLGLHADFDTSIHLQITLVCQDDNSAQDLRKLLEAGLMAIRKPSEKVLSDEELIHSLFDPKFTVESSKLKGNLAIKQDHIPRLVRKGPELMRVIGAAGGTETQRVETTTSAALSNEEVYKRTVRSTVYIYNPKGWSGSGSLIDRKHVLTNEHVARHNDRVLIAFPLHRGDQIVPESSVYNELFKRGEAMEGMAIGADPRRDLALIELKSEAPTQAQVLPLSRRPVNQGQLVHSIGNPEGSDACWVHTSGTVRQVYHRTWGPKNREYSAKIVETQSPTNHGDSGGPLVNDHAELIGVTQGGKPASSLEVDKEKKSVDIHSIQLMSWFIHVDEVKDFLKSKNQGWSEGGAEEVVEIAHLGKLMEDLKKNDAAVCRVAAFKLAQLGPDAEPALTDLTKLLSHKDKDVRMVAAFAVGQIGEKATDAVPTLCTSLKDRDMRQNALVALARIGPGSREAVPELVQLLHEEKLERLTRETTVRVLGCIGPDAREAVKPLVELLAKERDRHVRLSIIQALGLIGPDAREAVPQLARSLKDTDAIIRQEAIVALARLGKEARSAVPAMAEALRDRSPSVREFALDCFAGMGEDAAAAVPGVLDLAVREHDGVMGWRAVEALGRIGPSAKVAFGLLNDRLEEAKSAKHEAHAALSSWALNQIGRIGPKDAESFAKLLHDGKSEDSVRVEAARSLGFLGAEAHSVVPELCKALRSDQEPGVRQGAAVALGRIGTPAKAGVGDLATAFDQDLQWPVRMAAGRALEKLGPDAGPAVPSLCKVLSQPRKAVTEQDKAEEALLRSQTVKTLMAIRQDAREATSILAPLTNKEIEKDRAARIQAVQALGAILRPALDAAGDQAVLRADADLKARKIGSIALARALDRILEEDREVRKEAALALGIIRSGEPEAIESLIHAFEDQEDIGIEAVKALGRIGDPAVEFLIHAKNLANSLVRVRLGCVQALTAMGDGTLSDQNREKALVALDRRQRGYSFEGARYRPEPDRVIQANLLVARDRLKRVKSSAPPKSAPKQDDRPKKE
jgi:HEAT repeat protein